MMGDFGLYFELGFEHILDLNGIDHILFVIVMIVIYKYDDWKKILWIITSFTIAHSLTLILSAIDLVDINPSIIELLIAGTILFTAAENLFFENLHRHRVFVSGFFGLIHGLGFSNYFKQLVPDDFSIVGILFPFNLGIEVGQIVIVVFLVLFMWLMNTFVKIKKKLMIQIISGLTVIQSTIFIIERV